MIGWVFPCFVTGFYKVSKLIPYLYSNTIFLSIFVGKLFFLMEIKSKEDFQKLKISKI